MRKCYRGKIVTDAMQTNFIMTDRKDAIGEVASGRLVTLNDHIVLLISFDLFYSMTTVKISEFHKRFQTLNVYTKRPGILVKNILSK